MKLYEFAVNGPALNLSLRVVTCLAVDRKTAETVLQKLGHTKTELLNEYPVDFVADPATITVRMLRGEETSSKKFTEAEILEMCSTGHGVFDYEQGWLDAAEKFGLLKRAHDET